MDPLRARSPLYTRQRSGGSNSTGSSSPAMSPAYHQGRTAATGFSSVKKTQNIFAKTAAQRLAQVMASHTTDGDDDGDDLLFQYNTTSFGASSVRNNATGRKLTSRSPSPGLGRNFSEQPPSVRSASAGRPTTVTNTRPATVLVPPAKPTLAQAPVRMPSAVPPSDTPSDRRRESRYRDAPVSSQDSGSQRDRGVSALQDEVDMLQEENENILDKLRLAEDKCQEAEARARELEKQVAVLGEGVSLEARLLNRKEAALRQREAALKAAKQTKDVINEEIAALQMEVESARKEAATAAAQLQESESEAKSLRTMTHRMVLTQEEMEEVVLKRCWLARNWGLAVKHGIHADIAGPKHEHWSSLAPLPVEVVLSAGQKAKDEPSNQGEDDPEKRSMLARDLSNLTGEGNIESMLLVEKALRELVSLKVEDAVALAVSQHRRPNSVRMTGHLLSELSAEESEDLLFKQNYGTSCYVLASDAYPQESPRAQLPIPLRLAWLAYFWRRAKTHGVEDDIAEDRLQLWISRIGQSPTLHDAVDVERGLIELRKLGIESLLWEESRKEMDQTTVAKADIDSELAV